MTDLAQVNIAATYQDPHCLSEGFTGILMNRQRARPRQPVHDRARRAGRRTRLP
jgi:hypothetical protein